MLEPIQAIAPRDGSLISQPGVAPKQLQKTLAEGSGRGIMSATTTGCGGMSKHARFILAVICISVIGCLDRASPVEVAGKSAGRDYTPSVNCGDVTMEACGQIWWALYEMANHGDAAGICRGIAMDIEAWTWFSAEAPPAGKDMGSAFSYSGTDTTYTGEILVGSGSLEQFSTDQIVGLLAHEHGHAVGQNTTETTPNSQQNYCQYNVM